MAEPTLMREDGLVLVWKTNTDPAFATSTVGGVYLADHDKARNGPPYFYEGARLGEPSGSENMTDQQRAGSRYASYDEVKQLGLVGVYAPEAVEGQYVPHREMPRPTTPG